VGVESKPGDTIKVTPKDQTPPSPPDTLNGRILGEHALLEWPPVKADDLKSYRIYRAEEANGPFEMIDESSTESYLDTTVEEGDIFWYYVTALDESDNESRESPIVQVFREDKTPPAAPQQLEAVGTDDGIELKWAANGEKDLRGYLVERTTRIKGRGDKAVAEGPFFKEHVDPLTEPHYLDPVPKKSQSRYAYRIIALDNAWNESLPSEAVIARMPDHTPPGKPVLTDAVLDKGVVTLHWQPSIEEDLAGFRVYRARLGGGKETAKFTPLSEKLAAPDVIQFEDRPKGVGETFGYYITALDESDNESEPSDMMQVLVLDDVPPPAPINVQQQVTEQGIELSWELKQADDIARITVYRSLKGKDDFIIIADFDTKTQSFIDTQVTEGKEYTYRLTTMDSVDNESEPAEIAVLFQPQQEQNGGNEKKQ
jgi:fibronectin type 3 domain-containing protein